MLHILTMRTCLSGTLAEAKIEVLFDIINAFFQVSYGITTRSLSRYTNCSLRTLFRFLKDTYDWVTIRVRLFNAHCFNVNDSYLLVADETVEGKSRKKSHGLDYFYSSIAGQPIAGICFFGMSLVSVNSGVSYFLGAYQVIRTAEDKARIAEDKQRKKEGKKRAEQSKKLPVGRKKGTSNKIKEENNTASYRTFKSMFIKVLQTIRKVCVGIKVCYLVVDSAYGTADYLALAKEQGLFLLSKLRSNTCLVFPYEGEQKGKRPKQYGDTVDYHNIPLQYLKETIEGEGYTSYCYQFKGYAKNCFGLILLNIVVLRTVKHSDSKASINVWFCSDLDLGYEQILNYYHLRFQIEFDFRDAKQHFGFADFKNYKEENLTNFVNLSFTMCIVAKIYQAQYRQELQNPKISILDIKLIRKAQFTARDVLKLVRKQPDSIFNDLTWQNFMPNDLVNAA
jgi:putative transposase